MKKIRLWKGKLFYMADREVLIKAVGQATSTYMMSVFKLPNTLCDKLHATIAKFWWGGS